MIERVLRGLAGAAGLLFLSVGLLLLLAPGQQTGPFAGLPAGNAGFGALRGDVGGLFLGMAFFSLLGAIRASSRWLAVPAVFLGFVVFGRMIGLLLDGRSIEGGQRVALELALATVLLLTMASLRRNRPNGPGLGLWILAPALLLVALGAAILFQRQFGTMLFRQAVDQAFHNRLLAGLPDGLHAGLCGSGSPLPDPTRAGPCVFVVAGKHVFIVDAGEGSPRKLALMGLSPGLIDAILLTHFHSDHIGGLGEMLLERWATASHRDQVVVIGPQGVESVVKGFNDAYALDKTYRIAHHGEAAMPPSGAGGLARPFTLVKGSDASQVVWQRDGLTITAFAVDHGPVFPAAGYRFDYGGRSVVISGDTAPSPTLAKYAHGADVLFHEGLQTAMVSMMRDAALRNGRPLAAKIMADIPSYHSAPQDAARIARQAGVRRLVFYHMIPPLPFAYLNAAFLGDAPGIFKGPIDVGKDGMLFSLPAGGAAIAVRQLL
jgi:ribonuclease Z